MPEAGDKFGYLKMGVTVTVDLGVALSEYEKMYVVDVVPGGYFASTSPYTLPGAFKNDRLLQHAVVMVRFEFCTSLRLFP